MFSKSSIPESAEALFSWSINKGRVVAWFAKSLCTTGLMDTHRDNLRQYESAFCCRRNLSFFAKTKTNQQVIIRILYPIKSGCIFKKYASSVIKGLQQMVKNEILQMLSDIISDSYEAG